MMQAEKANRCLSSYPELMTTGEVSSALRISEQSVRALLASGEIPGRKISKFWRISRNQLENYISGGGVS